MQHDEIIENRAELTQPGGRLMENGCCDGELVFALKDHHHQFSLGLKTVLHCLAFAQDEGVVPALPEDWWVAVRGRYSLGPRPVREDD